VLSQFTGAARELTEALIVNPYDLEQASGALSLALDMPAVTASISLFGFPFGVDSTSTHP
jgi:trehalose-6-phosphate synthase